MIQLSSLTKAFGERVLFDNVTWQISGRERVGLCGPNGAGKTTLLKMFAGLEEPDSGDIIRPAALEVGYLPQDGLTHSGRTVYEEASLAFQSLLDVKAEMHALEARLGDRSIPEAEHDQLLARYSDLQDQFRIHEGYGIDLKIATVLHGLGFGQQDLERPAETFSGGWQMRLALAKLLLARPTLLLLDEPTNHLDLEARNWLEEYLCAYPHAVILVSHDRFFLDAVVNRITEVNLRGLTDYFGGYTHYLAERDAQLERLREAKRRQDEEVARMRQFIDRFRYQATKAAQVQSRLKMLEKITPIEVPPERKRVHFTFPTCHKSGRIVLELQHVRKAYGTTAVFRDVTLHFERGDRVALVGPNGAGKSTLMRLLSGVEAPDTGTRREGHQVVMQYFAQDEATRLDPRFTVYETLASGSPNQMVPAIRNILGGFLFSGDDVYKPVTVLSGGERTRLAVARMLLRPSNTLLLDEPTNHLDIDSKDVLLDALADFGGTLIFVSHDRYFVDRLATKVIEIGGGDASLYPGAYEEFLWKREHPEEVGERRPSTRSARSGSTVSTVEPSTGSGRPEPVEGRKAGGESRDKGKGERREARGGSRDKGGRREAGGGSEDKDTGERRETGGARERPQPRASLTAEHDARKRAAAEARKHEREARALKARIADLEARIAEREQALKDIETSMAAPGFYDDRTASQPVVDTHQALMWELGDLMHAWEELSRQEAGVKS